MTGLHNSLAHGVPPWEQSPRKLISLWDMIEFEAIAVLNVLAGLDHFEKIAETVECLDAANTRKLHEFLLGRVQSLCGRYELHHTRQQFHLLLNRAGPLSSLSGQILKSKLSDMRDTLRGEICTHLFAFIPAKRAEFFEREDLFGEPFHQKSSPTINAEIKAVGNCLASDLNTAAVFHAIRVAEMGMRRLASRLRAPVYRDKKRIKIEDGTWNEVLVGIKKKVESEKQKPKSKRRIKSCFRDYEILAGQLNRLKDDRNEVMHTHGEFNASEALGVFERVRDFMQNLAKRIPLR